MKIFLIVACLKVTWKKKGSKIIQQPKFKRRNAKRRTTKLKSESFENLFKRSPNGGQIKRSNKKNKTFQKKSNSNPIPRKKGKKKLSIKITRKRERELSFQKRKTDSRIIIPGLTIINQFISRRKKKQKTKKYGIEPKNKSIQNDLNIDFNFEHLMPNNDKEVDKSELNEIPFAQALRIDKRTTFQVFISVLENKVGILNLFFYKKKYSHFSLDLSIYLLELLLDLAMNCVLYTDDVVSENYNNNGEISMFTSLSLSIISNIISSFVVFIISKLVIYVEVLEIILKNVKDQQLYFFNILWYMVSIKIRLGLYFFFEIALAAMITYYLFIFCSVYHQSQTNIAVNYIVGACISLATSVGLTIFITIFRNAGFKYRSINCFNISRYLYEHF